MSLGERIKIVRHSNSITQSEFASRLLVTASYISKIEADKEKPSDIFLKLMSLEFRISLSWLKTGEGDKDIDESDYFSRTLYNKGELFDTLVDFEQTVSALPDDINSSIVYLINEYTHILKTEHLRDSQKIMIASVLADLLSIVTEMIDKYIVTDKNDGKELLRFNNLSSSLSNDILDKFLEIRNALTL